MDTPSPTLPASSLLTGALTLACIVLMGVFAAGPFSALLGLPALIVMLRQSRSAAVSVAFSLCGIAGLLLLVKGSLVDAIIVWVVLGSVLYVAMGSEASQEEPASNEDEAAPVHTPRPIEDILPDWLVQVDQHRRILYTNHPSGDLFPDMGELTPETTIESLFDPEIRPVVADNLSRSLTLGRLTAFEYYRRTRNQLLFGEMRIIPDGKGAWLIARDTTHKRVREEALRESKERFALAIQGANDGLWDWDLITHQVYYSHRWKAQLGHEAADVGSSPDEWLERLHPDDSRRVKNDLQAHLDGFVPRYESEHRIRHNDGSWRWVLTRGMAVRDKDGKARRIAGSMTELTSRRIVAATEEKSRLLEHATRAVGIGIAMRTRRNDIVEASPMLREIVAAWAGVEEWWYTLQEQLTLPSSGPCPSCDVEQITGSTRVTVDDPRGDTRVFELTFTGHGHEVQHDQLVNVMLIEDITTPALAEAKLRQLNEELVVARDDALASSRAKSAFLANMSHELRTPLNAIIGYSEMLLEDAEDEGLESAADLQRIHGAGSHLLGLIAGILDLSKVEAGIMQVELTEVAVAEVLEHVRVTAEPLARGNEFILDLQEDLGHITTDTLKLRQVLLNLLNNAFKFTDGGAVTLHATQEAEHLVLRVSDNGIGIPENIMDTLFDEFVQGDLSSTKAFQGAGLGLALCKRFVQLLSGTIEVESKVGAGSTFTVRLPRSPDLDPETIEVDVSAFS